MTEFGIGFKICGVRMATKCMHKLTVLMLIVLSGVVQARYDYDIAVIGSGAAGMTAAFVAAEDYNKRVVMFEKDKLGGANFNTQVIPAGLLIKASGDIYALTHSHPMDVYDVGQVIVSPSELLAYIREKRKGMIQVYSEDFFRQRNIDIVRGVVRFVDSHTLAVGDSMITADNIIIATGSIPVTQGIEGLDSVPYLTLKSFYEQDKLPQSMVIIGGGAQGVIFASALNRVGVDISLVMSRKRLLPKFDAELVAMVDARLRAEGVRIYCDAYVDYIEKDEHKVIVSIKKSDGSLVALHAEKLFLAMGREYNIKDLDLDLVGIAHNDSDGIIVDTAMQTNIKNIYACGDVVNPPSYCTNLAFCHARIAVHNICRSFWAFPLRVEYEHVPFVVKTQWPLISFGLNEEQARERYGDAIKIYRQSYNEIVRAHVDDSTQGLVKFICDEQGILLGAHAYGERANEIIDTVRIGEPLASQFDKQMFTACTSPSYLELLQLATERCL